MMDVRCDCSHERGATIVELLVSLALISVVFAAAAPLIIQSTKLFEATGRALTDPSATLAGAWLRRDVHSAASLHAWSPTWSNETIVLRTHDNVIITYEVEAGVLIRRRFTMEGDLVDRRVILRQLTFWRWRALQGFLDVEFVVTRHVDPSVADRINDGDRLRAVGFARERFCFALRRGSNSW